MSGTLPLAVPLERDKVSRADLLLWEMTERPERIVAGRQEDS